MLHANFPCFSSRIHTGEMESMQVILAHQRKRTAQHGQAVYMHIPLRLNAKQELRHCIQYLSCT